MTNMDTCWPTNFSRSDRRRFAALVQKACVRERLNVSGEIPHLTTDAGAQINLQNLLSECSCLPRHHWPEKVKLHFSILSSSTRLMLEGPGISPEVAEASLRIRLLPKAGLPDFCVTRPTLPGLEAALFMARPGFGHGVLHDMLENWGIDVDTAFDRALDNTLDREPFDVLERGDLFGLEGPSIYASTHALRLGRQLSRPFVVGIPTRHFVVAAFVDPKGAAIGEALSQTVIHHSGSPGPTSTAIWFVDPSTFGRWGEGAEPIGTRLRNGPKGELSFDIQPGPRLQSMLDPSAPST